MTVLFLSACGYSVTSDEDIDARARLKAAFSIASHTKLAVSESYIGTGRWPNEDLRRKLAWSNDDLSNPFAISVGAKGVIEIKFGGGYTEHPLKGTSLTLVPSGAGHRVDWACINKSVPSEYLPEHCR